MSIDNTYFGTRYSNIVSNPASKKISEKVIPITEVKFWKQHQSMSDLTPEVYGCESADNACDSWAPDYILRLSNKKSNGKFSNVEHLDSGRKMVVDDMLGRFSLVPENEYEYGKDSIGCRGGGGKIEDYKEGFRKAFRQIKKGSQNIIQLTLYRPFSVNGKRQELIIEDLDKIKFKKRVHEVVQEVWEIPVSILKCKNKEMKSKEIYLYEDAFNLDINILSDFLSKRFSQISKFNVVVEDQDTNESLEKKQVFFKAVDTNNNPISDLNQIKKYKDKKFSVMGKHFHLRYHYRLSEKWETKKTHAWKKALKNCGGIENRELIKSKSYKSDQPLLQVYDKNKLWIHTGSRSDFWSNWKTAPHARLELIVQFTDEINEMTSLIKSRGFSNDDFEKALVDKVLKIIQEDPDTFKNPHYDKITANETPEVLKFIDTITTDFGLQMSFQQLDNRWNLERTRKKSNWKSSMAIGNPAREIDLRFAPKEIPGIWFEFQSNNSDYVHCDGIISRILSLNAKETIYDTVIWVAKDFSNNHHEFIETVLEKVKWGNSNLSKIYFITKQQLGLVPGKQLGFQLKDLMMIDVKEIRDNQIFKK